MLLLWQMCPVAFNIWVKDQKIYSSERVPWRMPRVMASRSWRKVQISLRCRGTLAVFEEKLLIQQSQILSLNLRPEPASIPVSHCWIWFGEHLHNMIKRHAASYVLVHFCVLPCGMMLPPPLSEVAWLIYGNIICGTCKALDKKIKIYLTIHTRCLLYQHGHLAPNLHLIRHMGRGWSVYGCSCIVQHVLATSATVIFKTTWTNASFMIGWWSLPTSTSTRVWHRVNFKLLSTSRQGWFSIVTANFKFVPEAHMTVT